MNIIYEVKNNINDKVYLGYCTVNMPVNKIRPSNLELKEDIKRLGKNNFTYTILNKYDNKIELKEEYKKLI